MTTEPKTLFLYTIDFPHGNVEPYLHNELPLLSRFFKKVIIVSTHKGKIDRELPANIQVVFLEDIQVVYKKNVLFLKNVFLITYLLYKEFIACQSKRFFVRRFRLTLSELLHGLELSKKIECLLEKEPLPIIHYSFWMNEFALALSFLKYKNDIAKNVFRVHGFDLYAERRPHNYIPFREFCYRHSEGIFAVSKMGLDYIRKNYSFSEKAACFYLGTLDYGLNLFPNEKVTIVSCSGIIPLKRLHLIAEALARIDFPITWYHFGQGTAVETKKLQDLVEGLPANIKVVFKGQVSQQQLFEFYKIEPVSCFINVSETEGLPVSIMEAISFGIPIIATDVGGTSEIVTVETGILLSKAISGSELADRIVDFKNGVFNSPEFRKRVRLFWEEYFYAEKNYSDFCSHLLNLS